MTLRDMENARMKVDNIEVFKRVVEKAIEYECKFKEYGYWLDEKYDDHSDEKYTKFRATVVCINETYNDEMKYFKHGYKDVSSVTIYDIFYFYTDIAGGGFVINIVTIKCSAINAIQQLKVVK